MRKDNRFTDSIEKYISRYELLSHNGFYLVALSGGPDSVALLLTLKALGYRVDAVHCNFHLRGAESDRDESFCVELCKQYQIPLHRIHFDTMAYAELHHQSIEMAARELRYRYFEQLRKDIQADAICVAHHRDDQVETVLLNLIRGTGLRGLTGMRPKNGRIIRPFLGVSHQDILDYLLHLNQSYVIDSTNLEREAQRNQLRLDIIPLMENINPEVKANIARAANILAEVQNFSDQQIDSIIHSCLVGDSYKFSAIRNSGHGKLILWHILYNKGFNRQQIEEINACSETNRHWLSDKYVACLENDTLSVVDKDKWQMVFPAMRIPECGTYCYSVMGKDFMRLRLKEVAADTLVIDKHPQFAFVDAAKVHFPLTLRPVKQGDRFVPFGMKGSKLISDFMKDLKLPMIDRKQQLVVVDNRNTLLWVVGRRVDNRVAVGSKTQKAIIMEQI